MTEKEIKTILKYIKKERERELFYKYAQKDVFDIVGFVNDIGIELIESESEKLNKISGFIVIKNGKMIICINATDSPKRKRFTIAHELGHYFLHYDILTNGHIDYLYRNTENVPNEEEKQKKLLSDKLDNYF